MLPLGEFTVTIPQPRATLHGAVIRRNQCHDRATSQGVKIPSAILKIVFRHILFFALMQLRFRRAAAFVSSPIHLFYITFLHFFTFNGTYCDDVLMTEHSEQLLAVMRETSGEFFIFQQDSAPVKTISLLEWDTPAFISPDLWLPTVWI